MLLKTDKLLQNYLDDFNGGLPLLSGLSIHVIVAVWLSAGTYDIEGGWVALALLAGDLVPAHTPEQQVTILRPDVSDQ